MAFQFESGEPLSEAFARTAGETLQEAEAALTQGIESDPVEAIHTARKAIKKERALLRLMRGAIRGADRQRQNAALRAAGRRLSGARDADVLITALDDLSERYAGQTPHTTFAAVRSELEARRDAAQRSGDAGTSATRAAAELGAARRQITGWQLRRNGWKALDDGLTTTYRRGRQALASARRDPSVENLHAWRKRAKDLWYALRLLTPACNQTVAGQVKDLHRLTDLLGDDHDLAVLRAALQSMTGAVAADLDAVIGLVDHRRDQLQAEALLLGEQVYAEPPKAFRRRIRSYWTADRLRAREAGQRRPAELADATRITAMAT